MFTDEQIAQVCHEANRALQIVSGDPNVSPLWPDAPESQRTASIRGIAAARDGATPEQLHEDWCLGKEMAGWVYGPVKSEEAMTHPSLVPYHRLSDEERMKDAVYSAIVQAMTGGGG